VQLTKRVEDHRPNLLADILGFFRIRQLAGGVFQEPTVVLLIGLNKSRLSSLMEIVREDCQPHPQYIPAHVNVQPGSAPFPMIEAQVGGALVYLMNVDRFAQIN
jgi:uncharacterized protein YaaQ